VIEPVEILVTIPFPDDLLAPLREVSPRLHIQVMMARKVEDIPADVWSRVEVLYTDRVLPDPVQAANLRWIQFHSAGIDFAIQSPILQKPNIAATTLSGAAAIQTAEYAVMTMLALGHRLLDLTSSQSRTEWPRDRWERFLPRELHGCTVGLVGYGSINRQIARLLQPFGATILAAKRDVMHPSDEGYTPDGQGDPQGDFFHRLYPIAALKSLIRVCDYVVVGMPLTPDTRNMIGAEELAAFKPTAYLIDLARGGIINQAALIAALQEKRIAGAALDVFPEEPLPPNNPLWRIPNVIITPHISGISSHYDERALALFAENLNRYLLGQPLLNRFDPQRGY
jgi:phosphoglycerate dehydrogenase-like enzyme